MSKPSPEEALFKIADTQQGFFTAKQAIRCGYSVKNHHYHIRSSRWIREGRGVYRLSSYPLPDRPDLMRWYLWSRNREDSPQGVYSHETALSIYNLSDVMPAKLHMTVPKGFRKFGRLPKILILYKKELLEKDKADFIGVKVTTPIRTIFDVIEEGTLSEDLIQQAISDALRQGIIPSKSTLLKDPYLQNNPHIKSKLNEYLDL